MMVVHVIQKMFCLDQNKRSYECQFNKVFVAKNSQQQFKYESREKFLVGKDYWIEREKQQPPQIRYMCIRKQYTLFDINSVTYQEIEKNVFISIPELYDATKFNIWFDGYDECSTNYIFDFLTIPDLCTFSYTCNAIQFAVMNYFTCWDKDTHNPRMKTFGSTILNKAGIFWTKRMSKVLITSMFRCSMPTVTMLVIDSVLEFWKIG